LSEAQQEETTREADDFNPVSTRFPTSARLLAAIHTGDEAAIREFYLIYAPLLRDQARRMSIGPAERGQFVTTLLDDVVLHLMEHHATPRHLTRYLVASLRNRARNWHRDTHRRLANGERAYSEAPWSGERLIAECHSEYSVRMSSGPDMVDTPAARTSVAGLAMKCASQLSRDEMAMMIAVSRHVPLREIAGQIGVSYAAARVRLHRLRERLKKIALEHVRSLKPAERLELERFFRRAEIGLAAVGVTKQEKTNGKL
jgi:DNA-directed RNA polymerase specialized sigma24 family protein